MRLECRRIVVEANSVKAKIETKPLKDSEAEFFLAENVEHTFALYKLLKAVGMRVEIVPKGVKVEGLRGSSSRQPSRKAHPANCL